MLMSLEWVFASHFGLFATKPEREVLMHQMPVTVGNCIA
jgi:hypothetical protein